MKNFYLIFFSLAFLISFESIRADGHGEKKEVTEETSEEEKTTEEKKE